MKKILVLFIVSFSFIACEKVIETNCENSPFSILENTEFEKNQKPETYKNAFFILNEGGYTYGNASISAYFSTLQTVENNVFKNNNNYSLGDVAQSIIKKDDFIYITINNSQKIEVVKTNTFERLRTITGFSSPRYLQFVENEKVLVTDLYENKINVLDLETGCEFGSIKTQGWTEEIEKINGKFYAIERNTIGVQSKFANLIEIDAENLSITKRTKIPAEPNSLIVDIDDNIWVLSSGVEAENIMPALIKFNTNSESIEKTFTFSNYTNIAQNLAYHSSTNRLFFSKANSIFEMSISASNLPTQAFFTSNAQIIYGIDINPSTQEFYICDAIDYVSPGKVFRYSPGGNLIAEFEVGVLPSKVIF